MSSVTVELKCDDSTHLYWRRQGDTSWQQLKANPEEASIITETSTNTVTFAFVQDSGSAHDVVYMTAPGPTSQPLPASTQITSGSGSHVYFSKSGASPRWYAGYVRVGSS